VQYARFFLEVLKRNHAAIRALRRERAATIKPGEGAGD
jgi:hypothetical protein